MPYSFPDKTPNPHIPGTNPTQETHKTKQARLQTVKHSLKCSLENAQPSYSRNRSYPRNSQTKTSARRSLEDAQPSYCRNKRYPRDWQTTTCTPPKLSNNGQCHTPFPRQRPTLTFQERTLPKRLATHNMCASKAFQNTLMPYTFPEKTSNPHIPGTNPTQELAKQNMRASKASKQ